MGISLGLVGLGAFGSGFADLFHRHPLVDKIALCDRDPNRIAEFANRDDWQTKLSGTYGSLDEICKSDVDALVVITQHSLHAPQCVQAMESGKHVYSAVPVITVPDGEEILTWCDRLVRTCERTGLHYMLGETTYFRPETAYCRRQAEVDAFGGFVYSEGEYYHDVDSPTCTLRDVRAHRIEGDAGREWLETEQKYINRGSKMSPMFYPSHSTSGPMSVMDAHAVKVSAWGYKDQTNDPFFADAAFSYETALFQMSNGATMRICEHRQIGLPGRETFRIYGTLGGFESGSWVDKNGSYPKSIDEMRDPLPVEVSNAFAGDSGSTEFYGGHGGSHAFLAYEFVDAIAKERKPAISVWDAARYTAAGVAAHMSALKDGETVALPDWGDGPDRKPMGRLSGRSSNGCGIGVEPSF